MCVIAGVGTGRSHADREKKRGMKGNLFFFMFFYCAETKRCDAMRKLRVRLPSTRTRRKEYERIIHHHDRREVSVDVKKVHRGSFMDSTPLWQRSTVQ